MADGHGMQALLLPGWLNAAGSPEQEGVDVARRPAAPAALRPHVLTPDSP
jgi:hypothetical protein